MPARKNTKNHPLKVHAVEVARLERLVTRLLGDMENRLNDLAEVLDEAGAPVSVSSVTSDLRRSPPRSGAIRVTPDELEWMTDIFSMLSLELWRKEEVCVDLTYFIFIELCS